MKQYIYRETTVWNDATVSLNHTYVFDAKPNGRQGRVIAYVPFGNTRVQKLRTPLVLDLKGRTFEELK
jgi:hypothetical protein